MASSQGIVKESQVEESQVEESVFVRNTKRIIEANKAGILSTEYGRCKKMSETEFKIVCKLFKQRRTFADAYECRGLTQEHVELVSVILKYKINVSDALSCLKLSTDGFSRLLQTLDVIEVFSKSLLGVVELNPEEFKGFIQALHDGFDVQHSFICARMTVEEYIPVQKLKKIGIVDCWAIESKKFNGVQVKQVIRIWTFGRDNDKPYSYYKTSGCHAVAFGLLTPVEFEHAVEALSAGIYSGDILDCSE